MHLIIFDPATHSFNPATKTITVSEKDVPFATSYEVKNPKNGSIKKFEFTESTGPEFDPNTKWIYKCGELTLEVCNDKQITALRAENYLRHKLNRD